MGITQTTKGSFRPDSQTRLLLPSLLPRLPFVSQHKYAPSSLSCWPCLFRDCRWKEISCTDSPLVSSQPDAPSPCVCLVTPTSSKLGGWRGEAECGPSELKWSSLTSVSFKSPPANRRHSGSLDVIHSSEEQKVQEEDLMSRGLINCSLMSRSVFWIFSFSVATNVCVTSVIRQTCSELNYFYKRSAENLCNKVKSLTP